MENDYKLQNLIKKNQRLLDERRCIRKLPAEETVNALLDSPSPVSLIQSFPEEDFFFMMHATGAEDFLPVLALASASQWEYVFDIEVWEKDCVNIPAVTRWLGLLLNAHEERLLHWSLSEKKEFIEYYLKKNIEVRVREHDEDPSDFGDGFFTIDDLFYVKITGPLGDDSEGLELGGDSEEQELDNGSQLRDEVVTRYLTKLAQLDHKVYQAVLLESTGVIYSEVEEESYRLRNVRLAEKGFLPFDDAASVYQPMTPDELFRTDKKIGGMNPSSEQYFLVPSFHSEMIGGDTIFAAALKRISSKDVVQQVMAEFAGLCNKIISADQKIIRLKGELNGVVAKACAYLSLGLELLAGEEYENMDVHVDLITGYQLAFIFRVGAGPAQRIKFRAEKWYAESFTRKNGLPLGFWGENGLGILGGLLIKRPLFFNPEGSSSMYREFNTIDDLTQTEKALDELAAFDQLFDLMEIEKTAHMNKFTDYKIFILTLWARTCVGLSRQYEPMSVDEFKRFLLTLFAKETDCGTIDNGHIGLEIKESFLGWLSVESGVEIFELSGKLGAVLEGLFKMIEEEIGSVSPNDVDPKYIDLFLVSHE